MPYAFISQGRSDADLAFRVAAGLESDGVPCWIAPRDVPLAEDYADALEAGVSQAQVVVFLASRESMASRFCKAELEIARTDDVPILPLRLDTTEFVKGWRIYLSGHQWLWATGEEEAWIADVAVALKRLGVAEDAESTVAATEDASSDAAMSTEAMLQRFESYDAASQARGVLDHMLATGWTAHLPRSRQGASSQASYIRLTRQGKRRATAYLNSASLFVAGKRERTALLTAPGATEQTSGIYVDHSPTRNGSLADAIGAADQLTRWVEDTDAAAPSEGGVDGSA